MVGRRFFTTSSLLAVSAVAQAASITVPVAATIVEIQCTPEQRTRIRACAVAEERASISAYKSMAGVDSGTNASGAPGARFEIQVDPSRHVLIKTLLY